MLQQVRRADREARALLGRDKTGKTYLDTLVTAFINEGLEAFCFYQAEADWGRLLGLAAKAREILRDIFGPDKQSEYVHVDVFCEMAEKFKKQCGDLFEIVANEGREALATKHRLGKLHFQL
jgi:hypothetical protein